MLRVDAWLSVCNKCDRSLKITGYCICCDYVQGCKKTQQQQDSEIGE